MKPKDIKKLELPTAKTLSKEQSVKRDLKQTLQNYTALILGAVGLVAFLIQVRFTKPQLDITINWQVIVAVSSFVGAWVIYTFYKVIKGVK